MPTPYRDRQASSAFDAAAAALADDGAPASDLVVLGKLAAVLTADVGRWRVLVDQLDHAACARLDPRRAAVLIVESVFDEVLIPSAWRALSATTALCEARA